MKKIKVKYTGKVTNFTLPTGHRLDLKKVNNLPESVLSHSDNKPIVDRLKAKGHLSIESTKKPKSNNSITEHSEPEISSDEEKPEKLD